jgi:hypothetical protein
LKRSAFVVVVMLVAGVLQGSASTRVVRTALPVFAAQVTGSATLTGGPGHPVSLDIQLSGLQPSSVYIVRGKLATDNCSDRSPGGDGNAICPVIGSLNVDTDGNAQGSWSDAPHGSVLPLPFGTPFAQLAPIFQNILVTPEGDQFTPFQYLIVLEQVPATADPIVQPGPSAIYLGFK